ncbi:hypothetical protein BDR03DRAFT_431497 [Suillus americanus]|nr:hypothetical protein BDR03DRAFT_431497 [Suillus americanus]
MRNHLPVLSLFMLHACRPTPSLFLPDRGCAFRFTFPLSSHIVRPKSFLHIPISRFSLFLSSDPSHSFIYPLHLSLSSYHRPTQVAPSYIPFIFLFILRRLTLPSLEPARSLFHSAPDSGSLMACTAPFIHHYLLATPHPAYSIISAPDSAHSRTTVYMQFQPISLSLPQTSPIHTPMVYTQLQPIQLSLSQTSPIRTPTVYMQLQPISLSLPRTSPIRAPRFARSSSPFQSHSCPGLRLFAHHGLHAAPAYYITTSCPHRHFASNRTPSTTSFTRDFMIPMSGLSTAHLMSLYAL